MIWPMPLAPPVTRATLPAMSIIATPTRCGFFKGDYTACGGPAAASPESATKVTILSDKYGLVGDMVQGQLGALHHAAQLETGVYAGDPRDAGELAQQELLVVLHVRDHRLEQVIRGLAGDDGTLHYLG